VEKIYSVGDNVIEEQEERDDYQNKLLTRRIQPEALQLVPEAMARKYHIIPLEVRGNVLRVAMENPTDIVAIDTLMSQINMRIEPEVISAEEIQEAIDFNYQSYGEIERQISSISSPTETDGQ